MVHLLAELQPPNCINHAVYARVYSDENPCLVLNKINRLEFYGISGGNGGKEDLVFMDSLYVDEPILAMQKMAHAQLSTDCLLVLTDTYKLLVLWFDGNQFRVIHSVSFDASDQQLPSDALPRIEVDPEPVPQFFLVYFFEGFIQAFHINTHWTYDSDTTDKRTKRKLDQHEFADNFTYSLGSIIVQDIRVLRNANDSNNTIVVYYRDYNFNVSIRYYRLNSMNKQFNLVKQFEEFDEIPTAIINPLSGGSIVVTDNYMFYFPNPDITYLELSDENEDHNISIDPDRSVVTKRLITQSSHDISAFNNFTIIDEKRIILINNRGETFILFFNTTKKTSTSIQVNSISFIKLGMTTVPISIHHINDNLFYVASKLSQSVLFKILPQEPFIDIVRFLKSSSPILDIKANYNGHTFELLTCQGGYESGEFRRISNRRHYLEYCGSHKCNIQNAMIWEKSSGESSVTICLRDPETNKIQTLKIDNENIFQNLGTRTSSRCINSKQTEINDLVINEDGVELNGSSLNRNRILNAKILEGNKFLILTDSNTLYLYLDDSYQTIDLQTTNEVSDMDIVQVFETEFLVVVTFWDGSYRIYNVSDEEVVLLSQENLTPNEVPISSCCLLYNSSQNSNIWLLFTSSNNELVQIYYDFKGDEKDVNRTKVTKFDGLPYRFVKNSTNSVIMYNRNRIYGIDNDPLMNFNRIFPFDSLDPGIEINDLTLLANNRIAVSANNNDIHVYAINQIDTTKEVIFSNDFNMKSLRLNKRSKYTIVLSSKNAFIDSINEYSRNSFLQLVDLNNMETVSTYEFPEHQPVEMMDVCEFPVSDLSTAPNCFVGLSNSSDTSEILRLFQIKRGKIVLLEQIKLHGFTDVSELTMDSIKLINREEMIFMVIGVMNYIVKPKSLDEWYVVPEAIFPSPIFTNSFSQCDNTVVFGDVMKGINFINLTRDNKDNLIFDSDSLTSYVETNFLTEMIMFDSSEGKIALATDSFGNLLGLTKGENSQIREMISYNIGDSINTVTNIPKLDDQVDFNSSFDKLDNQEPLTEGKVIFGTVNGGIYSLSELHDMDEELESILVECIKEIVSFKHTLSDLQISNKRDKLERWAAKRDRKFMQQDETGQLIRKEQQGVIDLIFIQYWLHRDAVLRRYDSRTEETQQELEDMTRALKRCYKHKNLLQKLVFELSYV